MNIGDTVQVRQVDGVDHWVFAKVQDPATNRLVIAHSGNRDDGRTIIADPSDIRTKADVQQILTNAQAIVALADPRRGLSEAQIRQLAALDGFWASFLPPADGRLTEHQSRHLSSQQITLHQRVVKHYQEQLKKL